LTIFSFYNVTFFSFPLFVAPFFIAPLYHSFILKKGWTPLFWAVVHKQTTCVDVLLRECGANVSVLSTAPSTMHQIPARSSLLDAALRGRSELIAEKLRSFGVPTVSVGDTEHVFYDY